jgi:ABC-type multidrug transport system fused ATPase/permease subunit
VEPSAFSRVRTDFLRSPVEKWGALVSGVGAAVTLPLLLLLLYLFVDLLVTQGEVPAFAHLAPARQQEFATEWKERKEEERQEAVRRLGLPEAVARAVAAADTAWEPVPGKSMAVQERPPTAAEWETRWRAGAYLALREKVNQSAADAFLPGQGNGPPPRVGALALVVRERHRWTGGLVGRFAAANRWSWENGSYLTVLFILGLTVALVRGVLLNATAYLAAHATTDATTRLRRAVYMHSSRLGSLAVRTGGSTEAVDLFTRQVDAVGDALYAWMTAAFRYPVVFVLLMAVTLLVNFWLAVCFLVLAALVWVIGGQVAAYFRREARLGTRQAEAQSALLRESMGLIRLVKCYQLERFSQARVERQLAESGRASWRRLRGEALSRPLLMAVGTLAGVCLLYLAARSVLAGEFTVAGLVVMAVALAALVPTLAGWVGTGVRVRRGREAADAIFEFLDRKGEAGEVADAEFLPALSTRLEFRHVTLREPGSGRLLLDDVSFAVPAGSHVAVVGPDPEQKRALVYLLPRFLDPTTGEIRIEDKNIRWVTHESLRAQVAVVMQDDLVFTDTVLNNIGGGDPGYTLPQIMEAAKAAHAHQFIEKLPYGYETLVGDHGIPLRPGERFRIALARAILRDPSLLVIEEPAGPTDEDTLALLDDSVERIGHGRTIVFLANRLSTLRAVHRIFLIRNGKLEASGPHDDLWRTSPAYRRLPVVADSTSAEPVGAAE